MTIDTQVTIENRFAYETYLTSRQGARLLAQLFKRHFKITVRTTLGRELDPETMIQKGDEPVLPAAHNETPLPDAKGKADGCLAGTETSTAD
jgi:hypothetical protein